MKWRVASGSLIVLLILLSIVVLRFNAPSVRASEAAPLETTLVVAPTTSLATRLGEVKTINIDISNVQELRVFEIKVGYNSTFLEVMQVYQGSFFPSPPRSSIERLEIDEEQGVVWVQVVLSDSEPPRNGSGTLMTIIFEVIAPSPTGDEIACHIKVFEITLEDKEGVLIDQSSLSGVVFWKSIPTPPPPNPHPFIDLTTQEGGTGQGVSGGHFCLGETVEFSALVTYLGDPVQSKLVGFTVLDPQNGTLFYRVTSTNTVGVANIALILSPLWSFGSYTVIAVVEVAEEVIWDILTFQVDCMLPPPSVGGTATPILLSVGE